MSIGRKNISKSKMFYVLTALLVLLIVGFFAGQTVYAEISQGRGSFRLQVGQRRQLQSQGGGMPYRWSTSNSGVVVIDSSSPDSPYAMVRAVGEGTATIQLRSDKFVPTWGGGTIDTLVETWTVTVTAASGTATGGNNSTGNNTGGNSNAGNNTGGNSNTGNNVGRNNNTGTNTGSASPVTVNRVQLNKSSMTIKIGKTKSLTATLRPAGVTSRLTWTSSKPKVAMVNASGQVTALKAGKTKITVTTANGKKATCTVRVVRPQVRKIRLNFSRVTLDSGGKATLRYTVSPQNASGKVTIKSSNTKVAKVNKKGVITAGKAGKATITVKASSGVTAKCKVTVLPKPKKIKLNPKSLNLKTGDVRQLRVKFKPKKASSSLRWSSNNSSVASVSASGVVTAKRAGSAKITVKTVNGKKATCNVKVTAAANTGGASGSGNSGTGGSGTSGGTGYNGAGNVTNIPATSISISGASSYMRTGTTMNLSAAVSPSNTTDAVSWSSSNSSIASVSSGGVVRGLKKGGVTITARAGNRNASVKIAVVSGDVYDISENAIEILNGSTSNYVKYGNQRYTYDEDSGVTIVQSDPSRSNHVTIGGGKVTFANIHMSGCRITVYGYTRQSDDPYEDDIIVEFMNGTENVISYTNSAISYSSANPYSLILQGSGRVDLYSDYGPALSGEGIINNAPNLVLHDN